MKVDILEVKSQFLATKMEAVVFVLLVGLTVVLAQGTIQEVQFGVGRELVLSPVNPPTPITSITWKRNGDFVAEKIDAGSAIEYFGVLKGRSKLNSTTGVLTVSSMNKEDKGLFTVEINGKDQSVGFNVVEVLPVPKPEAIVRPLTCSDSSIECKLSCEPTGPLVNVEPVEYFWILGEKQQPGKNFSITNDEKTKAIKTFSCIIKNKISQEQSEPLENPFNKKPPGLNGGVAAGIIVGVFVFVCATLGVAFRKKIKPYLQCFKDDHHSVPGEEGGNK
uniref:Ig-like domain-containing protein n=1 Tax=Nothobranchius kadleci TaxID=1051664 RepID=A0A1A8DPK6_NOTKA